MAAMNSWEGSVLQGNTMSAIREQINQVVRELRAFHDLGKQSLTARPGRAPHGSGTTDTEAEDRRINANFLRKARGFADPKTGYNRQELDALCRAVRDHFETFLDRGAAFGVSFILRLVTIPKANGERDRIQRRLFSSGWSTAEFDAEIRRRYGRRRQGGRQKRVGVGNELLGQLEAFCASWSRWYMRIDPKDGDAGEQPINKLPVGVRDVVTRTANAIARLQKAIEEALKPAASTEGANAR